MMMPENKRSPIMDDDEIRKMEIEYANDKPNRKERRRQLALDRRAAQTGGPSRLVAS